MNREPQGAKGSHGNARGTRCHPGSTTHVEQLDGPLLCQGRPTRHTSVTSTVLEIRRAHPQANFFIPGRLKLADKTETKLTSASQYASTPDTIATWSKNVPRRIPTTRTAFPTNTEAPISPTPVENAHRPDPVSSGMSTGHQRLTHLVQADEAQRNVGKCWDWRRGGISEKTE